MYPLDEEHGDDEELCDKGNGIKFQQMKKSLPSHIVHLYEQEALTKSSPRPFAICFWVLGLSLFPIKFEFECFDLVCVGTRRVKLKLSMHTSAPASPNGRYKLQADQPSRRLRSSSTSRTQR